MSGAMKHVVIVGGGFAGLNAAKALADLKNIQVTLIDQRNHHLFQPLLYQVATAGLNPADIAVPIRAEFSSSSNIEVHLDRILSANLEKNCIQTQESSVIQYDFLLLACGAQHSYFQHPEWEDFAPGLKTLEQATEIRRRILLAFEEAENELDPLKQESLLNFVVVGGGPTGVELAGAIADISRTVLQNDFKRINPAKAKVILVEAGAKVLATFHEKLSAQAKNDLQALGVEVRTNARVDSIDKEGVKIGTEFIPSKRVFWAAGVQATKITFTPNVQLDRAGRVKVNKDFTIPGFPNAFVVGDMASVEVSAGKFLPGLAPVAIQSGLHAARMIINSIQNKPLTPFIYLDKGQMATIGRKRAVAESGKLRMSGYLAWIAWLFVHVFYLVGFKNRVSVMSQWVWSYLFSKRGARLITEREWKLK